MSDETKRDPTRAEMIINLKQMAIFLRAQVEVQRLNTELAELKAKEFKAIHEMAHYRTKQKEEIPKDGVPHVITQEDKDNYPEELKNVEVGTEVMIPKEVKEEILAREALKESSEPEPERHIPVQED